LGAITGDGTLGLIPASTKRNAVAQSQHLNFTHTQQAMERRTADTRANRRQPVGTAQYLRGVHPGEQLLRVLLLSVSPNDGVFELACQLQENSHRNLRVADMQLCERRSYKQINVTVNYSRRSNNMKLKQLLATAGVVAVLCSGVSKLAAQDNPPPGQQPGRQGRGGGGNFDPAQMQQRMMERAQEQLEIKDDAEWKAVQPLVQAVVEARMQAFSGMGRGMFGRGPRPGGDNNAGGGNDQGGRGPRGGPPSPEAETLQKAIDGKASNSEMKAALTKYTEARKTHQAALEKAQGELRKVLTTRQEAIATLNGLL
jgi:hypothetical protein